MKELSSNGHLSNGPTDIEESGLGSQSSEFRVEFSSNFGFRVQGLESTPWSRVYEREPHLEIILEEFEAPRGVQEHLRRPYKAMP